MRTYEGKRTIDGLVVTVDGRPLNEHYDVKRLIERCLQLGIDRALAELK